MFIAFIAKDKPGGLEVRKSNRAEHLAYLKSTSDLVAQAGPLLDENGEMSGSLVILNTEDMAEAEAWAAGDPFAKVGLFESTRLVPWNRVIG